MFESPTKAALTALMLAMLAVPHSSATAATKYPGPCKPGQAWFPQCLDDVTIVLKVGNTTKTVRGSYKSVFPKAQKLIKTTAKSPEDQQMLNTQLASLRGQIGGGATAGRKVSGSFSCSGSASTQNGASVNCSLSIHF